MNQHKDRGSKTPKDNPKESTASKPKENTSRCSSTIPPRKYGAHSGLKFNFNWSRGVDVKAFSFETRTEKGKGNASASSRKTVENQTNKEGYVGSGELMETLMENLKIAETIEKVNKTQPTESIQDDSKISTENEVTNSCSTVDKLLHVIKPLPQTSKVVESKVSNTMKLQPMPQASNISKIPSSTSRRPLKVAKSQPTEFLKPVTMISESDKKISQKKYGAHAGLKLRLRANGKKNTVVQPFSFDNRSSLASTNCSNSEVNQTKGKEMSTPKVIRGNRISDA